MNRIEVVILLTGAAVLTVEISAVRILSMYFGGTTYTVSGVITVILAALAVGYVHGGKRADAVPLESGFYRVIEYAGVLLLIAAACSFPFVMAVAPVLPGSWGPLLVALVLFAAPTYFLGMLSPYAVRLANGRTHTGVGEVSGRIFFFSTAGSLIGSLATTFVLIPHVDMHFIMLGSAVIVTAIGIVGVVATNGSTVLVAVTKSALVLFFVLVSTFFQSGLSAVPGFKTIYATEGSYGRIEITEGTRTDRTVRYLRQDRNWSGGSYADGEGFVHPVFSYIGLYKVFAPNAKHALFLGGGAYVMPRELLRESAGVRIDIVEVEPALFPLAQRFFSLPESDRITNHVDDCRRFIESSTDTYDIIMSDVYSVYAPPPGCSTVEFFEAVSERLSADGMFMANFLGSLSEADSVRTLSLIRTIQAAFPYLYVFAVDSPDSTRVQNILVVALKGPQAQVDGLFENPPEPLPRDLQNHRVDVSLLLLDRYSVMRDLYAPVEYLSERAASI